MDFIKKAMHLFSLDTVVTEYIKENPNKCVILNDKDIQSLQECLLKMLKDIDLMCREFGLEYALTGGNVLGKIRHNGFIPWDDDIDIVMPRADYEKFKKEFYNSTLQNSYTLKGPGCCEGADYRCMKIYKNGTIMQPVLSKKNAVNQVFIDVMPMDYVPNGKVHRFIKGMWCNFLVAVIGCVDFRKNIRDELRVKMKATKIGKLNYCLRNFIGFLLSFLSLEKWYKIYDRAPIYKKNTGNITIVNGKLMYFGEIVPKHIYYPFKECNYCGVDTWILHEPRNYLKHRYGEYMKVPNEADRETHHVEKINI